MDDAVKRIALAIQQGRGNQNLPPPVSTRASPPPLPPFQIPGMNTMGLLDKLGPAFKPPAPGAAQPTQGTPVAPPAAAATPSAPPMSPQAPAMPQPGAQEMAPGLPPMPPTQQVGVAPGMMRMPQNGPELDQWRQLMDSMQFGRQGA